MAEPLQIRTRRGVAATYNHLLAVLRHVPTRATVIRVRTGGYANTVSALAVLGGVAVKPDTVTFDTDLAAWISKTPEVLAWIETRTVLTAPRHWPTRAAEALLHGIPPYEVAPALGGRHRQPGFNDMNTAVAVAFAHGVPLALLRHAVKNPERAIEDALRAWHEHDGFLLWKHNVAQHALPMQYGAVESIAARIARVQQMRADPLERADWKLTPEYRRKLLAGELPEDTEARAWGGDVWVRPTIGYDLQQPQEAPCRKMSSTATLHT